MGKTTLTKVFDIHATLEEKKELAYMEKLDDLDGSHNLKCQVLRRAVGEGKTLLGSRLGVVR